MATSQMKISLKPSARRLKVFHPFMMIVTPNAADEQNPEQEVVRRKRTKTATRPPRRESTEFIQVLGRYRQRR
jgi:hypothetical protein